MIRQTLKEWLEFVGVFDIGVVLKDKNKEVEVMNTTSQFTRITNS